MTQNSFLQTLITTMICRIKGLYSHLYSGYKTTRNYDSNTVMTLCEHRLRWPSLPTSSRSLSLWTSLAQEKLAFAVQNRQLDICKDDLCFELKSKRWNHLNLSASKYYPSICFNIRSHRFACLQLHVVVNWFQKICRISRGCSALKSYNYKICRSHAIFKWAYRWSR